MNMSLRPSCEECGGTGKTERDPSGAFAMTCPCCLDGSMFYLGEPERELLRVIADPAMKRRDVAFNYRLASESHRAFGTPVDWPKVNAAIIERWSRSGLEWIKRQAWPGKPTRDANAAEAAR